MLIYCCVVVMVALLQAYEEGQRNLNSSPVMGDLLPESESCGVVSRPHLPGFHDQEMLIYCSIFCAIEFNTSS